MTVVQSRDVKFILGGEIEFRLAKFEFLQCFCYILGLLVIVMCDVFWKQVVQ